MKTTMITQIIAGNLDVAYFIKLISLEDRPKGQANIALSDTLSFNFSTGKTSIINEQNILYEKLFPNFAIFMQIISFYGVLYSMLFSKLFNITFSC